MRRRVITAAVFCGIALTSSLAWAAVSDTPFGEPTATNTRPGGGITAVRGARQGNWLEQSRSEVLARNGMVASSEPMATQAGLDILQQGGTAADAAVATLAMQGVTEPYSAGIGGDAFILYWSAEDQQLYGMNASGWAPESWDRDYFTSRGMTSVPLFGVHSVVVPGAMDGFDQLLDRFGNMNWRQVLEPAVHTAENGFGLTERIHSDWRTTLNGANGLNADPASRATFTNDGQVPPLYSIVKNPDLADTYRLIQKKGIKPFYRGEIADAIVNRINELGGEFTREDLSEYHAEWTDPISTDYKGYKISTTAPNSQGFATLEMLNIIEQCAEPLGYDLKALGPRSPEFWHILVEAKKIAYSDLFRYVGDPKFVDVPVDELTSDAHAQEKCDDFNLQTATPPEIGGNTGGGTVYITVADRYGNMVSFISSIYEYFGSRITVPGYGFPLANRGNLFSLNPSSPNIVEPRKRPFNTIIPAFVQKDDRPVLSFGSMGGDEQPQAQATELVDMIDLGYNLQAAGDAARFHHSQGANRLDLEGPLYDLVGAQLQAMGHNVRRTTGDPMYGYQAIKFTPSTPGAYPEQEGRNGPVNGIYRGASDFRKDGQAAGW